MLEVTRYNFGEWIHPRPTRGDDVTFWLDSKTYVLADPVREATGDYWAYETPKLVHPFALADFTTFDRLSWPVAATSIAQNTKLHYWGERYAVWLDRETLSVIDATRATVLALQSRDLFASVYSLLVHGPHVWFSPERGAMSIPLAALAAMFDRPAGRLGVRVREVYPRHRPGRFEVAKIVDVDSTTARAKATRVARTYTIPRIAGVELGVDVTLRDELYLHHFIQLEIDGWGTRPLYDATPAVHECTADLAFTAAIDPAGDLSAPRGEAPTRQSDLDALFREIADHPDDDATRTVLVDMLEDSGAPYAPLLAVLRAGETNVDTCWAALGPLAKYLERIEYRGGLPFAGTMIQTAPVDDAIADIVANDQRLGLFSTLRLGQGPFRVYAKLVGSPRAVALRHVDMPNHTVMAALIAAGRTELRAISSVKLATREMIEGLAHTTFDRVERIATETGAEYVARLLSFVARDEVKFFARAPRHLILTERSARDDELVGPVLAEWDRLPVGAVTVAGVTLRRDGTATVDEYATAAALGQIRQRFRIASVPT